MLNDKQVLGKLEVLGTLVYKVDTGCSWRYGVVQG